MAIDPFWERIKILIKKKKYSGKKTAEACGINPRTFQNWMQKGLFPTIHDGYNIACYLGVSVEFLVTGHEGKVRKQIIRAKELLEKVELVLEKIDC